MIGWQDCCNWFERDCCNWCSFHLLAYFEFSLKFKLYFISCMKEKKSSIEIELLKISLRWQQKESKKWYNISIFAAILSFSKLFLFFLSKVYKSVQNIFKFQISDFSSYLFTQFETNKAFYKFLLVMMFCYNHLMRPMFKNGFECWW